MEVYGPGSGQGKLGQYPEYHGHEYTLVVSVVHGTCGTQYM